MLLAPNRLDRSIHLTGDLIGFPTVSSESNRDLLAFVVAELARSAVASEIIWNQEASKGNLWATIGPADLPGVILSGHSDVVPVDGQEWSSPPFEMRRADNRLYGRGACDMKGFLGAVLAAVPDFARAELKAPIHIAISYDEELGCTGVRSLIDRLARSEIKPSLCIVGEPTRMQPVVSQKGGGLYRLRLRGRAAHSSLAPRAVNAVELAADAIGIIRRFAGRLMDDGPRDEQFDVPWSTMSVTRIRGGAALNIIPGECELNFDLRSLPEVDAAALIDDLRRAFDEELLGPMRVRDPDRAAELQALVELVPLATDPGHPAVALVKFLAGRNDHGKVAYGTEAGLFSRDAGIASVVCGPGSIEQAHKPDEFIEVAELRRCGEFLDRLAAHLSSHEHAW